MDGCLSIYPMDEWEAFEEKLRALPLTNKDARTFSRFFVAGATTCELDRQGRILVPQTLREFAGLEKDVVLTGNSEPELRSGARRSGARTAIMMIWTALRRACRTWESSSEHNAGEKSNRRRIWNLSINLYYWTRPLTGLNIKPDGIYVDGTLGGAGHAIEVCRKLSAKGRFIGIDQDQDAIIAASERLCRL